MKKEDYKAKYYQELKDEQEKEVLGAWIFIILIPIVNILVWIFGNPTLWTLKDKLWCLGISLVVFFLMGIWKRNTAKKEIDRLYSEELGLE